VSDEAPCDDRRLGHANPTVTMTVYGHFLPEKDRAAADFLDDLLDG
jgi:hypothetical protein